MNWSTLKISQYPGGFVQQRNQGKNFTHFQMHQTYAAAIYLTGVNENESIYQKLVTA